MTIKTSNNYRSRDLKLIFVTWMFLDQNPSNEEHAWKNGRVYLLMLLPTCASHARDLCVSDVFLVQATYAHPSVVALHLRWSCTPKIFNSMTWTTILALQSVGVDPPFWPLSTLGDLSVFHSSSLVSHATRTTYLSNHLGNYSWGIYLASHYDPW